MSRARKIAAHTLLFLVVPTSYILAGLKDGFTLELLDFGTSPWWNVGLVAFLLSSYLFAWMYNHQDTSFREGKMKGGDDAEFVGWVAERLWAIGQEGRLRALEYDGDPIEELHHILPEDLSAEEWQSIMSGAYD